MMCVVSMVGDHYKEKWQDQEWYKHVTQPIPSIWPTFPTVSPVSREEFEELKRDVQEALILLRRAKKYDEDNNEPECEIEEKMEVLRKVAELVGVDLSEVLGKNK